MSAETEPAVTVGVLALQGAFCEHIDVLKKLGVHAIEVRSAEQLASVDGLILPGGESTTMGLVARRTGLLEPLRKFVHERPAFGTCAGMILLADEATGQKKGGQELLGGLRITVDRNHFGSQISSFVTRLRVAELGATSDADAVPAIFIRAPGISRVGEGVKVLAVVDCEVDAETHTVTAIAGANGDVKGKDAKDPATVAVPVAVRQGHLLATAFHPELSGDLRFHGYFVDMVRDYKKARQAALAKADAQAQTGH